MGEISGWIISFSKHTQSGAEPLGTSIFYVIASLMLVIMIFSAKIFAEKVANVSMEGAMGGAMSSVLSPAGQLAMKPAGKAAGMAMNYGKAGGKLATKGAWAVGKGLGKGGYSLAKKMYERARNEA